jgi:hypothetical protein
MTDRRFPPPRSVEELEACFIVRDNNGQQLAHVYCEDEPRKAKLFDLLQRYYSVDGKLYQNALAVRPELTAGARGVQLDLVGDDVQSVTEVTDKIAVRKY